MLGSEYLSVEILPAYVMAIRYKVSKTDYWSGR